MSRWVLAFFVMVRDGNQEGEVVFHEGRKVTIKKIIKPVFVLL